MTPRIGPVLLSDLVKLAYTMRDDEKAQWCSVAGLPEYNADEAARMFAGLTGVAYCLVDGDGEPLAAAGFEQVRPKVWQAWMAGTPEAWAKHWRKLTVECKRRGDKLLRDGHAHRLQILALASRTQAHRWYEAIGYRFESRMERLFADGSDAVCYVRTGVR